MGNKVGLRIDSERNLFVEALVYEIKGRKVRINLRSIEKSNSACC